MASQTQLATLEELVACFEDLEDPRSEINRKHPLVSVVAISMMAVLAGADGPTSIHRWAGSLEEQLPSLLDLPNGIPSRDVIRRVLCALKPEAFQECFSEWISRLIGSSNNAQRHVAVDGKTLRGSGDSNKGIGPLHLVSAWASERGLTLAQVPTDQKSNEITAIPELLRLIDLKKSIITIDAMGTQKKIAQQIVDGEGNYILALKANHETTHAAVINYVEEHVNNDFAGTRHQQLDDTPAKPGHGRSESRIYIQFEVPKDFPNRSLWAGLTTIGLVVYTFIRGGKEHTDIRYYISSLPLNVAVFAKCVRNHWCIENTCHWSLDVTYNEDALKSRNRLGTENMAWLRRFTLSLLKQHPGKMSLAMKRKSCGWNWNFLLQVLGIKRA
ncbi:MAG: ISAs1 family transposase [Planctomycetales bacterium]|nr:ISAs1 family transposase [Planctomycetales bacterium]